MTDAETELQKRKEFDKILDDLDKKFAPWIKAIQDSERLTAEDMQIRFNARD